ncbi:lytic transglycosylase domain-containing protein [Paenibacillus ehimensis]|uniref:Lytic transglycosylase domain-containing protein n=1 Tax=Paenibacillus ehimensis TaxID=79264 RepID=A0ABT8VB62_9BACL|nr:lytic transglycosylase domain-containing protein [Paenibacillus ehimensis]MDO3678181.1 lytic transglycosylase domain-containing protein [Paenibacillus ehimensis]MEC0210642.1 lytic transglycosylase domain-containing protein [Paenibacillus ehimensis]
MNLSTKAIDPYTIKELLQLQVMNQLSLLTSGRSSVSGQSDHTDFASILNGLLAGMDSASPQSAAGMSAGAGLVPGQALGPAMLSGLSAASAGALTRKLASAAKPSAYEPLIQEASRRFGVEPSIVKAVIHAESSFNANAVSGAGAKGLMQLMDATGQGLGVDNPFDPAQNIEGGTRYLSNLLSKYGGSLGTALAAYNAGPTRLDRLGIRNDQELAEKLHLLPAETQQYVRKVLALKEHYEA